MRSNISNPDQILPLPRFEDQTQDELFQTVQKGCTQWAGVSHRLVHACIALFPEFKLVLACT